MTTRASSDSGKGYWSTQIGVSALFGAGGVASSYVLLVVNPDEPGGAVLLGLLSILFLTTCGWALDTATRSSRHERALFAWAIAQHEAAGRGNDALAMRDAARARDGKLDATRIQALQALRPDNPFPVDQSPRASSRDDSPAHRDLAPNRTRLALTALYLALTGLYFSCMPSVYVLGWPFQLVAFILAVFAIVPRGRGRRLGVTALVVAALGTLVTVVFLLERVITGPR